MMVRGTITRLITLLALVLAGLLAAPPAMAPAAPKAAKPTAVSIMGRGMERVTIDSGRNGDLFQLVLGEVSWLATATPQASARRDDNLGPKYTLTVYARTAPQQVYDLYPLAAGGPRAFRPAEQPTGKKKSGWFFGRFTMSESLRVAGVPLPPRSDVVSGGIGGGIGQEVSRAEIDPVESVNAYLDQMRRLFLLNGAVLVVVLFGLAGVAFLIRRRV
jgi:hypothetical protein